jgi:CxxC motif-containing protein (DUF1111 family)
MFFKSIVLPLLGLSAAIAMIVTAHSEPPSPATNPHHPGPGPAPTPTITGFGNPLPGLTTDELLKFSAGKAQFQVIDGPAEGLGPLFNAQSCFACHTQPATLAPSTTSGVSSNPQVTTPGGASAFTESRAGRLNPDGSFNPLANEDGTLFKLSSLTPASQEIVPADATIVAHRKTTPLFGSGLIEAIPDATIAAGVHNPAVDGVTGKVALLSDAVTMTIAKGGVGPSNFVGRFGWKDQEATLLAFAGDAYLNEIGVTNRFFGTDLAPDGNQALLVAAEPLGFTPTTLQDLPLNPALPESPTNKDDIALFADFMEFLGAPPPAPLTGQARRGAAVFKSINCVACHTPSMTTGPSNVSPSLAFKNVPLYSDLLLHNMGSLGDGIPQAVAGATEMRTPPLWGLRARGPFLHDGRAESIEQAIEAHDAPGSEAQTIARRFEALPDGDQDAVIAFLNSI